MTERRDGTTGNSNSTKNRRVPTPGTLRYPLEDLIGPVAGRVFAKYTPNGTFFLHADTLGSSFYATDWTGQNWVQSALYDPWGQQWVMWGTSWGTIDDRYAGMRERDTESWLDPTPNRMYASLYSRWLSPDPLGGNIANPQSLNRYAYVVNDPCSLTDPLGLQSPCSFNIAIAPDSLTGDQLTALESELTRLFGGADLGVNFVAGNQSPDYFLSITSAGGAASADEVGMTFPNSSGEAYENVGYAYNDVVSAQLSPYGWAADWPYIGTALGQVARHEFLHYAFQMQDVYNNPAATPESAGIMWFFDPACIAAGDLSNFTRYQAPALQGFCSRLHPHPQQSADGGGAGGGGGYAAPWWEQWWWLNGGGKQEGQQQPPGEIGYGPSPPSH
jgi:RHS repeat-associated protein